MGTRPVYEISLLMNYFVYMIQHKCQLQLKNFYIVLLFISTLDITLYTAVHSYNVEAILLC